MVLTLFSRDGTVPVPCLVQGLGPSSFCVWDEPPHMWGPFVILYGPQWGPLIPLHPHGSLILMEWSCPLVLVFEEYAMNIF